MKLVQLEAPIQLLVPPAEAQQLVQSQLAEANLVQLVQVQSAQVQLAHLFQPVEAPQPPLVQVLVQPLVQVPALGLELLLQQVQAQPLVLALGPEQVLALEQPPQMLQP